MSTERANGPLRWFLEEREAKSDAEVACAQPGTQWHKVLAISCTVPPFAMIDENAYGLFLSYYDVENEEYALERDPFVERLTEFSSLLRDCVKQFPLGSDLHAVDLGHAVYVEMADDRQEEDPIVWLKMTRARLKGRNFETSAILTYGGRWVDEDDGVVELDPFEKGGLVRVAHASEPFRKALYADAASRRDEETEGWGPGLYVDTEAVEAMGRALKNAPTPLNASGATFYRMGK